MNSNTFQQPRVEYHELGQGPAIVMLHGGQCCADDWANITPRLAQRYRLILPDGLVFPLDPWRIWRLLDHLGIGNVALVGHSKGGTDARQMYRLQPHRVWALVDIDGAVAGKMILARKLPNSKFSPQAAALYEQNREAMQQLKPHHHGDYPSAVTLERRSLGYRRAKMSPEQRAGTRTGPPPRVLDIGVNTPPPPEPIPDTGKFITCPVMVFHTGRGKLGPEDISPEWIKQNIQADDVEYVVIKECGHWPWLEQPEWFLSRLEPFLARAAPSTK
ncbi:MAG: alpha/beta hydrolase [Verrucomicrobia bacterium]|nr:alpha/beta hydrolase [Verrucomicrobiota bacterium]